MMLYALATPGVDCSAATVRDAMEVSLSRCLNMPPMLPKASLYGDWDGARRRALLTAAPC